jgi:hypothetical protein
MLVMLAWKPVEGQRLLDVLLHPGDKPRILGLPFADPGGEIGAGFRQVPAIVQPAEFL